MMNDRSPPAGARRIRRRNWTPADLETIGRLVAAGRSDADITCRFRATVASVTHARLDAGIRRAAPAPKWTQAERDRLAELAARGMTRAEICAAMGRTKGSVVAMALSLGIEIRYVQIQHHGMAEHPVKRGGDAKHAALLAGRRFDDSSISLRLQPAVMVCRPATQVDRGSSLAV